MIGKFIEPLWRVFNWVGKKKIHSFESKDKEINSLIDK